MRRISSWQRDGEQVHEERITPWHTSDLGEAIADAGVEAQHYARGSTEATGQAVDHLGMAQAYLPYDTPGQGAEVFSLMRTHPAQPEEHLGTFFDSGTKRTRQGDAGPPG